jgi:site-specific recombinase XerD
LLKKFGRKSEEKDRRGRFVSRPPSYEPLLVSQAIRNWIDSYRSPSSRSGMLYTLKQVLDYENIGPEEFLRLSDKEIKDLTRKIVLKHLQEQKYASARRIQTAVKTFLEANDREIKFKRKELVSIPKKKVAHEIIPTKYDIYRMANTILVYKPHITLRNKAIILCLFQSGVRVSCLCRWTYGMVEPFLYRPEETLERLRKEAGEIVDVDDIYKIKTDILVPVRLKITNQIDTKLGGYGLGYYYTFLSYEAAKALKDYIEDRKDRGWNPKPEDFIFVTATEGKPLTLWNVLSIVKNMARLVGIDPRNIWTHTIRKAFRKVLYQSGMDPDMAEAIMGHKLPGSRGSYFDFHDVNLVTKAYIQCNFAENGTTRLNHLERQVRELEEELERRNELVNEMEEKWQELVAIRNILLKYLPERAKEELGREIGATIKRIRKKKQLF